MTKQYLFAIIILLCAMAAGLAFFNVFVIRTNADTEIVSPVSDDCGKDLLPVCQGQTCREKSWLHKVEEIQSTADRLRAIEMLSTELSFKEQQEIVDFIKNSPNGSGEYVIKNNLMNCLLAQKNPMPELAASLIAIAGDKKQDIVVRAYAVQHLRPLYERFRDAAVKNFLYVALLEEKNEVCGGAMLALNYLMKEDEYSDDFDIMPVIQQARKIALDNTANNNNRITAIQVAAVSGDLELAVALREIISDKNSHSALRISAIAGLGNIGDEADIPLLESISRSDSFERVAAEESLRKLRNSLGLIP